MINNKEILQLYSRKQILLSAIIAGPLSTGYVLARNFENINRKRASMIAKISGYFFLFCLYVLAEIILEFFFRSNGQKISFFLAYFIVVGLFFVIQAAWAGLFYFIIHRFSSFKSIYERSYSGYTSQHLIPLILLGLGLTIALISMQAFLFIFILVIFLPALYIFNHLKNLAKKGIVRNVFGLIYFLFAFLFPISQILYRYFELHFFTSLIKLGYLFLPFELYAFLGFIGFDIVVLFFGRKGIFSIHSSVFPVINHVGKCLILVATFLLIVFGHQNFNNTQISKYSINIAKKNPKLDNLKIALAADIHFAEITSKNFIVEFVNRLNSIDADIVLIPGDIFESDKENADIEFITGQMKKIESKYGVFGVPGNHEYYGNFNKKLELCKKSGIQMIRDSAIIIDRSFVLAGRNDRHDKNRKSLTEILAPINKDLPIILMDHRPDAFASALKNNIDLQVSGHTHNGQLFPNNYITELIYDLSWGYKKIKDTHFFVTSGVQGWGPQVRTTAHSEIMVIDVGFTD